MSYILQNVFDDTIQPSIEYVSQTFTKARLIVWDAVPFSDSQQLQISAYLTATIQLIGKTVTKDLLLPTNQLIEFLDKENESDFNPIVDSLYLSHIPREFSDSDLPFTIRFNIGSNISAIQLRIYAFRSDATIEDIKSDTATLIDILSRREAPQVVGSWRDTTQKVAIGIGTETTSITEGGIAPARILTVLTGG